MHPMTVQTTTVEPCRVILAPCVEFKNEVVHEFLVDEGVEVGMALLR